ncbi:MAG TPA: lipopolysaccharide assembly protein LapA domain-containing protein [Candidatus Krumholzibacterium sp.]|nr:lipopolysaccharide assembly protein LapA domain-containing protein [Candidatus Krumholzibacterium sp.]
MWIIRGIIYLAGVVALVWLGTKNAGTKVTFHLFNHSFIDVELNVVLVVTFMSGMIVWAVGAWIREAQLMLDLVKERKKIRKLREELSDLRNLPLDDDNSNTEEI